MLLEFRYELLFFIDDQMKSTGSRFLSTDARITKSMFLIKCFILFFLSNYRSDLGNSKISESQQNKNFSKRYTNDIKVLNCLISYINKSMIQSRLNLSDNSHYWLK